MKFEDLVFVVKGEEQPHFMPFYHIEINGHKCMLCGGHFMRTNNYELFNHLKTDHATEYVMAKLMGALPYADEEYNFAGACFLINAWGKCVVYHSGNGVVMTPISGRKEEYYV